MASPRRHLSYANVVSTLCLFLLLGGAGAWAATHLPANSVGSKQLKKGAVTLQKIDASAQAALQGQKGETGGQGPQGVPGPPGEEGPPGEDATKRFAYIYDEGPTYAAKVQWGEGVTGISDPETQANPTEVYFAGDLSECAISVTAGQGVPTGPSPVRGTDPAEANVTASQYGSVVSVRFWSGISLVDSSFFVVAFC